jgi:hypothetical protein
MHNFKDIVKRCYQKNSDEEISNGSIKHAKILADYLFNLNGAIGRFFNFLTKITVF